MKLALPNIFQELRASVLAYGTNHTNGLRIYFHTMVWGRTPRWAQFI